MGAWGTGNFANDSALDWVADLDEQQDGLAYIEQTLRFVLEETEAYVGERAMSSPRPLQPRRCEIDRRRTSLMEPSSG